MTALDADRDFLKAGGVMDDDMIDAYIELKKEEINWTLVSDLYNMVKNHKIIKKRSKGSSIKVKNFRKIIIYWN